MEETMNNYPGFLKRTLAALACCAALGTAAHAAQPIKIEVGFPPGGATDVIARLLASELSIKTGRDYIVENRPGASGNIAGSMVAHAPADGNTLLFASSTHATNAALYSDLTYSPEKDFVTVAVVATSPYVLVVNRQLPVHTLGELTTYLKAHPGKVAFASSSPGTGQHLAGEVYKKSAGVDIMHVPYKGSSAALPDLIAGRVGMMFDNVAVMTPHTKAGELVPLAVTSPQRFPLLPDVPTVAESGYPGFSVIGWFALLAPANTPTKTVTDLNAAVDEVLRSPKLASKLADLGAEPKITTLPEANKFMQDEMERWRKVIQEIGLKLG
jgi:tripartite-type tricarboxylate transporter receptor subunit TctC